MLNACNVQTTLSFLLSSEEYRPAGDSAAPVTPPSLLGNRLRSPPSHPLLTNERPEGLNIERLEEKDLSLQLRFGDCTRRIREYLGSYPFLFLARRHMFETIPLHFPPVPSLFCYLDHIRVSVTDTTSIYPFAFNSDAHYPSLRTTIALIPRNGLSCPVHICIFLCLSYFTLTPALSLTLSSEALHPSRTFLSQSHPLPAQRTNVSTHQSISDNLLPAENGVVKIMISDGDSQPEDLRSGTGVYLDSFREQQLERNAASHAIPGRASLAEIGWG
ncbi:hypothetical protein C8F01DRAFT_1376751 [Mycena amicta]|nr:hypothetical protein C8F01DRAFT_1376751 [Mycena amicta]